MKRLYFWLTVTFWIWPLLSLLLALVRFGRVPPSAWNEAISFLGMGLLSGVGLLWLLHRAPNRVVRTSAVVGYLVVCPFAFLGALLAGLGWRVPFLGTAVYGGVLLLLGAALGYFLGHRVTDE